MFQQDLKMWDFSYMMENKIKTKIDSAQSLALICCIPRDL